MSKSLEIQVSDVGGEKTEFVDMRPPAHNQVNEPPVYIDTGWLADVRLLDEYICKLIESGRCVLAVNAPHGSQRNVENSSGIEDRKSICFSWLSFVRDVDLVNGIAHSQGSITLTNIALQHPQKFQNLLLFNPSGLSGNDSFFPLLGRFVTDAALQVRELFRHPVRYGRLHALSIGHAVHHPCQSVGEVFTNAHTRITDRLHELNDLVNQIQVITTTYDIAFPIERIRAQLDTIAPSVFEDGQEDHHLVPLHEESGTHNQIYFEQARFADITIDTLTRMHAKNDEL